MPSRIELFIERLIPGKKKEREARELHTKLRRCIDDHGVYAPENATGFTVLELDHGWEIGYLTPNTNPRDKRPIRNQMAIEHYVALGLIECGVPRRRIEGEMKI